jgi:hypothetical protein
MFNKNKENINFDLNKKYLEKIEECQNKKISII